MRFWRFLFFIFLGIFLSAASSGFLATLPAPFYNLNAVLVVLIFLLFLGARLGTLLLFAFWAGLLQEMMNFTPLGPLLISLVVASIFSYILFVYLFTNRSLPALWALGFFSTIFFRALFFLSHLLISIKTNIYFSFTAKDYLFTTGWELLFNLCLLTIFYFAARRFSKRLDGYFLIKKSFIA